MSDNTHDPFEIPSQPNGMPEQGTQIDCVDCTVLYGPNDDCPYCQGSGKHFQAAQMADRQMQWQFGRQDQERCDELGKQQDWEALAGATRGCLVAYAIYGIHWLAGYLNKAPDEWDFDNQDFLDAMNQSKDAAQADLKAAFFKAKEKAEE